MNKSTYLSKLAIAGIASGMLALSGCDKSEKAGEPGSKPEAKQSPEQ